MDSVTGEVAIGIDVLQCADLQGHLLYDTVELLRKDLFYRRMLRFR